MSKNLLFLGPNLTKHDRRIISWSLLKGRIMETHELLLLDRGEVIEAIKDASWSMPSNRKRAAHLISILEAQNETDNTSSRSVE